MVTTKLNLSMTEPSVRQIYAKQGDTGRVLDISLDQTPEDGTLRILRPDGVEVTSEAVTGGEVESGGTFESLTEADVTELTVGIEPVQDLSHGDPSPTNICPITGHDEVRVYDDPVYGKTIVWNQILRNGNFARTSDWAVSSGSSFTVSNNVATFRADAPYRSLTQSTPTQERVPKLNHVFMGIIKAKSYTNTNTFFYVRTVGSAVLQTASKTLSTTEKEYVNVLKVTQESYYFQFMVQDNNASGYGDITVQNARFFDLTEMFGEGNEPTIEEFEALFPKDYYPHNTGVETTVSAVNGNPNRQYTTSLGQTVYGGTLDMVTGVLTVTHGNIASYNGETLPSTWISDRDVYASGTTPTTGAQVVYELATPLTYTLTAHQIKTLVGTNNVWASSGDIVSIKFAYGGMLSELPSDATSVVGKCYCDVEQNGVSSMPFTLNVKKNERAT